MKISPLFCLLGLLGSIPWVGRAEIKPQDSILGKFLVSSVNGTASCVTDGRIVELKKGDTILARGAKLVTARGANAILVLSNGTAMFAGESTELVIERFEQEPFTPSGNLRLEPSNSVTVAKLLRGQILLSTPRLLSGTSMIYQTPHAAIAIRGDKLLIEANEAASHIAMIEGSATVSPRDAQGNFLARGERVEAGQEAFVRFNVIEPDAGDSPVQSADPRDGAGPKPVIDGSSSVRVVKLTGSAEARGPEARAVTRLSEGSTIPTGSILSTGADTLLFVQPFPGAITAILPLTVATVEQLSIADNPASASRKATLALQVGSMISILEPSRHENTEYSVRTLHGTASARGTLFFTSVKDGGLMLATTADSVSFTSSHGEIFQIDAGHAVLAQPGQNVAPPIPLVHATKRNAQVSEALRQTFTTLASVVSNNLGGLTPAASAQLLAQTAASSSSALPEQAERFAASAAAAIASPGSSLGTERTPALAAALKAIVAGLPDRATPTATAAARSALPQGVVIATAAASGAPAQATQVAESVANLVLESAPASLSAGDLQTLASLAAAVSRVAPKQASSAAAAVMQAVLDTTRDAAPPLNAQRGAAIAAAATRAAPDQAVPIARTMMQLLAQRLNDPAPTVIAQTGALLAGAIISVVPEQAQPVATAVMLLMLETHPQGTPEWTSEVSGIFAAALARSLPATSAGVYAGIGDATGFSPSEVKAFGAPHQSFASELVAAISQAAQSSALAFAASNAAHEALLAGIELARPPIGPSATRARGGTSIEINHSTSVIITRFDPAHFAGIILDLNAALAAQTTVQFYTEPDGNGGRTVRPWPTVPRTLPAELLVSPAALPR